MGGWRGKGALLRASPGGDSDCVGAAAVYDFFDWVGAIMRNRIIDC